MNSFSFCLHSFYCLNCGFLLLLRLDEYESSLTLLQETVRGFEVSQLALDCIKTGESPEINGKINIIDNLLQHYISYIVHSHYYETNSHFTIKRRHYK